MLTFPGSIKIYVAIDAFNMCESSNGIHAIDEDELQFDSKSGALSVFTNKRRNRIRILCFDGSCLFDHFSQ